MTYQDINAQEAIELIATKNVQLVDVREAIEFAGGHIPDSELHPVSHISTDAIKMDKDAVIVYCQKGVRGAKACKKICAMMEQTIDTPRKIEVFNLSGGIEAWESDGLDIVRLKTKVLPLQRQVQLAIGLLLLLFSAMSIFVNHAFVWAIVFMSVGLIIAGISGFCGLARLVAMMPWNNRVSNPNSG
ncbi:rhodanese-like domain-containing protein [Ningiella sp. W23]|uniref:rhodanese-like domain-containing protein n=1 Tax=Ningiella sp. W23 TaxID=3023715 RepID=UPI003756FA2E